MTTPRTRLDRVLAEFHGNPPATEAAIERVRQEASVALPEDYLAFLRRMNGGEGFVGGNAYVILWRLEDLGAMNEAYQVSEYAPGLLLFGSDGGGEAFAFDMRSTGKAVVSVPFVGMDVHLAQQIAQTFEEFLAEQAKL